jgi:hypothetical protein
VAYELPGENALTRQSFQNLDHLMSLFAHSENTASRNYSQISERYCTAQSCCILQIILKTLALYSYNSGLQTS